MRKCKLNEIIESAAEPKSSRTGWLASTCPEKWCSAQIRVNSSAGFHIVLCAYFSRNRTGTRALNLRCPCSAVFFRFHMQGKSQRLVELDFFRGLVLLVIVVDHIGGSMLSRVTLHAFALNDAAEVFVFLGGFATATAYESMAARRSESAARARFFRRAFEIYRAFVVTAVLMCAESGYRRPGQFPRRSFYRARRRAAPAPSAVFIVRAAHVCVLRAGRAVCVAARS
jgi:hypothetical protein